MLVGLKVGEGVSDDVVQLEPHQLHSAGGTCCDLLGGQHCGGGQDYAFSHRETKAEAR